MKLSGWVRLWVVASALWWGGGCWWLNQVEYDGVAGGWYEISKRMPPLFANNPETDRFCQSASRQIAGELVNDGWDISSGKPSAVCQEQIEADWRRFWTEWSAESWKAGHLPAVLLGPVLLAALMLGVAWITAGFRSSSRKLPKGVPESVKEDPT